MGFDSCVCSHNFVTIDLINKTKEILNHDQVDWKVRNRYYDKENVPEFPDDDIEPDPDGKHEVIKFDDDDDDE